jgi:hypothetical protein
VSITASLSPVVKYHGLARRYVAPPVLLMRPLLNGATLGGQLPHAGAASLSTSQGSFGARHLSFDRSVLDEPFDDDHLVPRPS